MGSFDTASLSTESLEDLNLGKVSELLKLGHHRSLFHHRPELAQLSAASG
ncbi:hypothetical protein [Rhodococcus sp. APC 3903]|nr:hypothetical protein [Rhodococcus sp. APC 3903]MDN3459926.1 hypothetical protein [Rhodococcus sp. APC 3903]